MGLSRRERLRDAMVLVELGELYDAEAEISELLDESPEDLTTLDLTAKIKHMRGQLSQAVACWAQVHARSPQEGAALLHLSSMLQLARDPERGAGEFLALGPMQLWRKPSAHLELEEAFRLFLARRPEEAAERCERLARAQRGNDQELTKLAVLARAWIAELAGDRDQACRILEELGAERGFETDTDRILMLARLYEQSGKPEHLWKALHICEYLERNGGKTSVLGRLASLHRALGHEDDARRYETRFLLAFRRRMHRPSPADVAETGARRYLPLGKLLAVRFPDAELAEEHAPPEATAGDGAARRARAIRHALAGRVEDAAELFASGATPLDTKYLADLAALRGDTAEAVRLYLRSLEEEPADVRVLGWLLEHHARTPSRAVTDYLTAPGVGELARAALEGAVEETPLRPSLWRHLAALDLLLGDEAAAGLCAERAEILADAADRRNRAVGRALAAAVYHFVGKPKGLIHEVWAGRRRAEAGRGGHLEELLGNLTPEMVQNTKSTFLSVREYARAKLPHLTRDLFEFSYTFKMTKEDEPSGGLSAGLPTALAFLSVFLDRPLPQDVASSGVLVTDAHDVLVVKPVGETEHKVRGAYNRNLATILLPRENRRDLRASARVPAAVCGQLVKYVTDLDEAATLVFGAEIWGTKVNPARSTSE